MGANCCVAARSKSPPSGNGTEISRNVRYSPSWSFRWDNRTHIEDIVDNNAPFSHQNSGNVSSEIKNGVDSETEGLSDEGSPVSSSRPLRWHKSPTPGRTVASTKGGETDISMGSDSSIEDINGSKLSTKSSASNPKDLIQAPQQCKADPSSACSHSLLIDPTSSKKARRSPGDRLSRQISDSRIPVLKSLNENNSNEGRHSFVLPASSSDVSARGSHGGSSDGWSMRMFSELIASSQRERWSFDSESFVFGHGRTTGLHSQPFPSPPSADQRACGVCSKRLKERCPWSSQKILSNNELSVAAILVCGHVYHAECLENVTLETDRFDPACPLCTNGGKSASKLRKAELKARSKISRIAVADVDLDIDSVIERWKGAVLQGERSKMEASSSFKSSFSKPFLKRHFSIGPKTSRSLSVNETTKKKGFWARYRKD